MNLATKIGVALFVVFVSALCMTTVLNYLRFEQTLQTLLTQRINVVTSETNQDLHAAMDLGLRLESMENLEEILERRAAMSPEISRMTILDCQGTPIAATDQPDTNGIPGPPPSGNIEQSDWVHFGERAVAAGTTLYDSLGQCAGLLHLQVDDETYRRKLENASAKMWKSASMGMLAILPVLGLLVVLMRRRHRVFDALHADLEQAEAGKAGAAPTHDGDVLTESELELVQLYREIRDQLPRDAAEEKTVLASADKNA